MKKEKIEILNTPIRVDLETDYVCISDIAKIGEGKPAWIIRNYLKNRSNMEFLILWEKLLNDDFKVDRMAYFKDKVLQNKNALGIQNYIDETGAIGINSTSGRYGGTYAHKYIAIHFAAWIDPSFFLYFIVEFERLKRTYNESWIGDLSFFIDRLKRETEETNLLVRDMDNIMIKLKRRKRGKKLD